MVFIKLYNISADELVKLEIKYIKWVQIEKSYFLSTLGGFLADNLSHHE